MVSEKDFELLVQEIVRFVLSIYDGLVPGMRDHHVYRIFWAVDNNEEEPRFGELDRAH